MIYLNITCVKKQYHYDEDYIVLICTSNVEIYYNFKCVFNLSIFTYIFKYHQHLDYIGTYSRAVVYS